MAPLKKHYSQKIDSSKIKQIYKFEKNLENPLHY
jgi:hypothetical protein